MPLYDTLTGLDLNIQIQITPSEEIPGDISEAFVDNLKQMADEVLSNTVRLEQRQTSLWHLPRSNVNPTEYYMLNVFLFNRSDVIKYSAAIDEIRQFFRKMKTGVKLSILEPSDIKLTFQFKHGLELSRDKYMDMSNGQIHKPLMEKDWTLMYPSPYMTISDVTWCLRTVFDLSEFEEFAFYIIVKSTDNIVFIDQYDRQENQCFVCIDLFIELTHVEEDSQIIREGKPASEDDKEMSVEVVVDSTRGLIVTVTLIAVILLLVILYKVKSAMTRKQFEESDNRSNHTPDFVELNVISS